MRDIISIVKETFWSQYLILDTFFCWRLFQTRWAEEMRPIVIDVWIVSGWVSRLVCCGTLANPQLWRVTSLDAAWYSCSDVGVRTRRFVLKGRIGFVRRPEAGNRCIRESEVNRLTWPATNRRFSCQAKYSGSSCIRYMYSPFQTFEHRCFSLFSHSTLSGHSFGLNRPKGHLPFQTTFRRP